MKTETLRKWKIFEDKNGKKERITPPWKDQVPVSLGKTNDQIMDEETEGVQNIQNENGFGDQMPLYPDNYDVKRTVGFLLLFY